MPSASPQASSSFLLDPRPGPRAGWLDTRRGVLLTALALVLLAAPPRLWKLGDLSFYGDEETSALVARSVARGEGARMPSGMEYRRALPLTWMMAGSVRLIGEDREVAYRLPVAILGILSIPALFLLGRAFVGAAPALAAAVLLAFSEWHLVYSRQARMYEPAMLLYLAAAWALWRWAGRGRGRDLLLASALLAAAVIMHQLGVMAVLFAVVPLAFAGAARVRPALLAAAGSAGITAAFAWDRWVIAPPYRNFAPPEQAPEPVPIGIPSALDGPEWIWVPAGVGAGLGLWAAIRARPADAAPGAGLRAAALALAGTLVGAMAWTGHLYGAALAGLVFLVIHPSSRGELVRRAGTPALLVFLGGMAAALVALLGSGAVEGAKRLVEFPFPYPAMVVGHAPGAILLFAATCLWLALRPPSSRDLGLRAAVLGVILPLAALGIVSRWGGTRYLYPTYPFFLLGAGAALVATMRRVVPARLGPLGVMILALGIVSSGVLGGHGIPQAIRTAGLSHGQAVDDFVHMIPVRPDHRGAGTFVAGVRSASDVVMAEDPLQQRWYAGPVDYWLRSTADGLPFVHRAADGELRDIYTGSILLDDVGALEAVVQRSEGRVWLITSGETSAVRHLYLEPEQLRWLEAVETSIPPHFVGLDGATNVYCLNCTAAGRDGSQSRSGDGRTR